MEKLTAGSSKIRIIKSSFDKYWYKGKIGEEFFFEDVNSRNYIVKFEGHLRAILKSDAILVETKNPLI